MFHHQISLITRFFIFISVVVVDISLSLSCYLLFSQLILILILTLTVILILIVQNGTMRKRRGNTLWLLIVFVPLVKTDSNGGDIAISGGAIFAIVGLMLSVIFFGLFALVQLVYKTFYRKHNPCGETSSMSQATMSTGRKARLESVKSGSEDLNQSAKTIRAGGHLQVVVEE